MNRKRLSLLDENPPIPRRCYTIVEAWHAEILHWKLTMYETAFLMAFVYCLMLRLRGTSYEEQFPTSPEPDYRAD